MARESCSHRVYGSETTIGRRSARGLSAAFAVVSRRPLERLDLERHPVDADHPHLLTGGDGRRPVRAGPPPRRADADDAVGVDGLDDVTELTDHPLASDRRGGEAG